MRSTAAQPLGVDQTLIDKRVQEFRANTDYANVLFDRLVGYAIIAADFDGNILAYNAGAKAIYGYEPEDVIGRMKVEAFYPPEAVKTGRFQQILDALIKTGNASYEGEKRRRDDRLFPAKVLFMAANDKQGKAVGFIEIVEDLTERTEWQRVTKALKEYNKQLMEIDRLKTEFLGNVSHELRTPLTVIVAGANNLFSGALGSLKSTQKEWIAKIRGHAERLQSLINDILDLSKLESGDSGMDFSFVDTGPSLEKLLAGIDILVQEHKQTLASNIPPNLPRIWGCALRIEQVLTNFITNAMKYGPEGGKITVSVRHVPDHLEFIVSDEGPGIPPEAREAIFDRFRQVGRKEGTPYNKGIGLGLAICREIISQHKGKVWVEPGPGGRGSSFVFRVPIDFRTVAAQANAKSVLIVDDDMQICDLLGLIVSKAGFRPTLVNSGSEALKIIQDKSQAVDMVFLDVMLPGLDGRSVLAHIRRARPELRVVVISAFSAHDLSGADLGPRVSFMAKPLDIHDVELVLKTTFGAPA